MVKQGGEPRVEIFPAQGSFPRQTLQAARKVSEREQVSQAKVTGVDMSPGYIRFCRAHGELRNASNVEFYQANAEDLSFIESNSIDFINFAYVLHEVCHILGFIQLVGESLHWQFTKNAIM